MASSRLTKALATGNVKIQRAPRVSGEVTLSFKPLTDRRTGAVSAPAPIRMNDWKIVDPMQRVGVTLEHLRHSNIADLVRRQAIVIL